MTLLRVIILVMCALFDSSPSPVESEGSKSGISTSSKEVIEHREDINPLDRPISEPPIFPQPRAATENSVRE